MNIGEAKEKALKLLDDNMIAYTLEEGEGIEVTDLGLNDIENIGLQIITYENNERYCAKEIILLPNQTCPEHRHPALSANNPGKQETFRVRYGTVYLFAEGINNFLDEKLIPKGYEEKFNVKTGLKLEKGMQYTLKPNTLHWFKAGKEGAIVSEFSSTSDDSSDIFTDENIKRVEK
ncbi:MAG: D-lyxose/D-mannose family sugar isomerase [Fusobacteriaceae bacterium]